MFSDKSFIVIQLFSNTDTNGVYPMPYLTDWE